MIVKLLGRGTIGVGLPVHYSSLLNVVYALQAAISRLLRTVPFRRSHFSRYWAEPFWYYMLKYVNYVPKQSVRAKEIDLLFSHEYFPLNLSDGFTPIVFELRVPSDDCILGYGYDLTIKVKQSRYHRFCGERATSVLVSTPGEARRAALDLARYPLGETKTNQYGSMVFHRNGIPMEFLPQLSRLVSQDGPITEDWVELFAARAGKYRELNQAKPD